MPLIIPNKVSIASLNDALEEAMAVSSEGCKSLNDLDTARYHIQEALDDLEPSDGNDKAPLPTWAVILIVVGALILIAALVILVPRMINKSRRKKRNFERFKKTFKSEIPTENDETLTTNIAEDEESNRGLSEEELTVAKEETPEVVEQPIEQEEIPIEETAVEPLEEAAEENAETPQEEESAPSLSEMLNLGQVVEIEVPAEVISEDPVEE